MILEEYAENYYFFLSKLFLLNTNLVFAFERADSIVFYNRIFQIPKLGTKLKQDAIPLSYTPRKFITHPTNRYFYLIEGDHRTMGEDAVAQKLDSLVNHFGSYFAIFYV